MLLGHHGGLGGGPPVIHPSTGITAPPAHDPVSIGLIVLVVLVLVLVPVAAGVILGYRPGRQPHGQLVREAAGFLLQGGPDAAGVSIRDWGVSRTFRIAVTLFMSPCDDCGAVRGQPCKLIPLVKTIVVDEERWWVCHISRVVKGVTADKALYMALLSEWTGELPAELKGLYADAGA